VTLTKAFLPYVPSAQRPSWALTAGLEEALGGLLARARAKHSDFTVSDQDFLRHVAERLAADVAPVDALAGVRPGDLYLACGCAGQLSAALEEFDRLFRPVVAQVISKRGGDKATEDEVAQRVRSRVLMGSFDGRPPRIVEYTGRGPLVGWVMAVTVRVLIDLRRSEGRQVMLGEDALPEVASADFELEFIKQRYRGAFKLAFEEALQALTHKERNLLRLKLLDGLNIDEMGSLYAAHRATVARWLVSAREALRSGTRARLAAALKLDAAELDSLLRVIDSKLDVSISRFLRPEAE
jgi:RNA polymerase sigma-70 factor (ECF subfamily)